MDQAFSYSSLVMSNANTFPKARQPVAQHGGRLMPSLFESYDLGPIRLKNRIVMAPMERSRARNADLAPTVIPRSTLHSAQAPA
jgi:hypothetical protein